MTKRLGLLAVLLIAAIGLYNCRKDVVIEPPPSLVGRYTGTYTRAVQVPESLPVSQHIVWVFTDTKYYMDFDSAFYPDQKAVDTCRMCDVAGIYLVSSGVLLTTDNPQDSNRTKRSCIVGYAPDGQYQLDQSTPNTVKMSGLSQNAAGQNVLKTINLTLKP